MVNPIIEVSHPHHLHLGGFHSSLDSLLQKSVARMLTKLGNHQALRIISVANLERERERGKERLDMSIALHWQQMEDETCTVG